MNALRFQQLDPRLQRLLPVAVWLLLALAATLYIVKPDYLAYRNLIESRHQLESQTGDIGEIRNRIAATRAQVDVLKQQLLGDTDELPLNRMESYLIGRLQGVSWGTDIELVSVKPGDSTQVLGFDELAFEVEVQGDYHALYAWLRALRDKLGFILVKHYDIAPLAGNGKDDRLQMRLTMVFYRTGQV
jgi:hypothetical protein